MGFQQMMVLRKSDHLLFGALLLRMVFIAMSVSTLTSTVRADGGAVLWQRTTGPFRVTAFTTESPLRTGPTDISLLIESVDEPHPLVDAQVFITLENEAGTTVRAEATHRQARNKLLYCSLINLPEAGHWKMKIIIEHGGERAEFLDHLIVSGKKPMVIAYWKLLAFPPTIMILFVINQWLGRNRPRWLNENQCLPVTDQFPIRSTKK
jgi:hypothetical protein